MFLRCAPALCALWQDYCGSGLEGYENFIAVNVSIYRQNMLTAGIIAGCVVIFISVTWINSSAFWLESARKHAPR